MTNQFAPHLSQGHISQAIGQIVMNALTGNGAIKKEKKPQLNGSFINLVTDDEDDGEKDGDESDTQKFNPQAHSTGIKDEIEKPE